MSHKYYESTNRAEFLRISGKKVGHEYEDAIEGHRVFVQKYENGRTEVVHGVRYYYVGRVL